MVINMEEWKDIKSYEGLYMISSFGRVKVVKPRYKGKVLLSPNKKSKYLFVTLYKDKKGKNHTIHRLVAEAFLNKSNEADVVNHIDGDKKNNNVNNLEWITQKENVRHAIRIGNGCIGERNGKAKLTNKEVRSLRNMYIPKDKKFGCRALAKKYNVATQTMWRILNGRTYKKINANKNIERQCSFFGD